MTATGSRLLDQLDAPGAVEHAQGEAALHARDLIMVQLHGVCLAIYACHGTVPLRMP